MKAGELHSAPVRQLMTPDPYSPPTRNAAFFIDGITTTHCALDQRSCGMPLSGALRISLMIVVASVRRFASSPDILANVELAARHSPKPIATVILITNSSRDVVCNA